MVVLLSLGALSLRLAPDPTTGDTGPPTEDWYTAYMRKVEQQRLEEIEGENPKRFYYVTIKL